MEPRGEKDRITSAGNEACKWVRSLQLKKNRDENGVFVLEGEKMVEEFLQYIDADQNTKSRLHSMFVSACFAQSHPDLEDHPLCRVVADTVFDTLTTSRTPQGILAVAYRSKDETGPIPAGRWVVLDGVQDPGNVGTILRTICAAGASGLLLLPGCADPYGPKAVQASMSGVFKGVVRSVTQEELAQAVGNGMVAIGADMDGDDVFRMDVVPDSFLLFLGSEGRDFPVPAGRSSTGMCASPCPARWNRSTYRWPQG